MHHAGCTAAVELLIVNLYLREGKVQGLFVVGGEVAAFTAAGSELAAHIY
jgi:hypothetical protein